MKNYILFAETQEYGILIGQYILNVATTRVNI